MYKWNPKIAKVGKITRKLLINKIAQKKLINDEFTIFSNDCFAGQVYHIMGKQFKSPTVNCFIRPIDFVKFLENVDWYLNQELIEVESSLPYPVAKLGNIHVYMVHYKTFDDGKSKWEERKRRINWDNVYVYMTDRYCLPMEYRKRYDNLPFKNKVLLTVNKHEGIECEKILKYKNDECCVGVSAQIQNIFGKFLFEYTEDWDYISWLNCDIVKL